MCNRKQVRAAVTPIELIVVFGILGFVLALVFPIIQAMRATSRQTNSLNNLKQLGLATHNCADSYRMFPPAVGSFPTNSKTHGTAHFYLLPFLEQNRLFQNAKGFVGNNKTHGKVIKVFLSPQDPNPPPSHLYQGWLATCNYPANWLVFGTGNQTFASITDGSSNTLMFTERYQMCNKQPHAWGYAHLYYWAPIFAYYSQGKFQHRPKNADCDPRLPQSMDADGILVSICDGSVRTVSPNVSPRTWANASNPRDGNPLGNDF